MAAEKGLKYDAEKLDWSLLPVSAVNAVVDVLTYGARKYQRGNWRRVENAPNRYYAALMRHLIARVGGEVYDRDSGKPHLACVACNALFLLAFELLGEIDELGEP